MVCSLPVPPAFPSFVLFGSFCPSVLMGFLTAVPTLMLSAALLQFSLEVGYSTCPAFPVIHTSFGWLSDMVLTGFVS